MREKDHEIIVAMDENNCIGLDNKLPWRIPSELETFYNVIEDRDVIVGRNTYHNMPNRFRTRPERTFIVSRMSGCDIPYPYSTNHVVVDDPYTAMRLSEKCACIIGGSSIYRETLHHVDRIHLTRIHGQCYGNRFFPKLYAKEWEIEKMYSHRDGYTVYIYERKSGLYARQLAAESEADERVKRRWKFFKHIFKLESTSR